MTREQKKSIEETMRLLTEVSGAILTGQKSDTVVKTAKVALKGMRDQFPSQAKRVFSR